MTDKTAAIPNPIAVYPDDGGIGNVGDDTATATAYSRSSVRNARDFFFLKKKKEKKRREKKTHPPRLHVRRRKTTRRIRQIVDTRIRRRKHDIDARSHEDGDDRATELAPEHGFRRRP